MKTFGTIAFLAVSLLFWGLGVSDASAGEMVKVTGVVKDTDGNVLADIRIRVTSGRDGTPVPAARTDESGAYSLEISADLLPVFVEVDPRELLQRGYFCVPGSAVNLPIDPGLLILVSPLIAVPLRPDIRLERSAEGVSCVRLSFDWADGIVPSVLRQYRLERSSDLENWEPVITVALACPPMEIMDETRREADVYYYRTVPAPDVFVADLLPEDFQFIADPTLGWAGEPFLEFDATEPMPATPVVAPTIFIRSGK